MSLTKRIVLCYLTALAAAIAFLLVDVKAHTPPGTNITWYDVGCCSDGDCEPLPIEAVTDVGNGWMVRYESARWGYVEEFFPDAEVRQSKDGQIHGCFKTPAALSPRRIRCLYIPVSG